VKYYIVDVRKVPRWPTWPLHGIAVTVSVHNYIFLHTYTPDLPDYSAPIPISCDDTYHLLSCLGGRVTSGKARIDSLGLRPWEPRTFQTWAGEYVPLTQLLFGLDPL
jgi:hypothetical protein